LFKDTMQLSAFNKNSFFLGHAAMLVNEGLPSHVVEMAKRHVHLEELTTGILGMAFKAENDDPRDSLSYKLRKLLMLESKRVLCADPYVKDKTLVPQEQLLEEADVIFIGAPHKRYRSLKLPKDKVYIDVWNCLPPNEATRITTSNSFGIVEEVHPRR
jgi:UDP-N-acetyl-D-mannosaminuronic acid dehydrogenase